VKGPAAVDDDIDDDDYEIFKSPVHAFLEKNQKKEVAEGEGNSDSLLIQVDNDTGEIVSQKTQIIRGSDGSSRTIKTVEKIKDGDVKTEKSIGEVKIVKVEEMMKIQEVDDHDEAVAEAFDIPAEIGRVQNSEADLSALVGKDLASLAVEAAEEDPLELGVEDPAAVEEDQDIPVKMAVDLADFLNPASRAVQELISAKTVENPRLLSEILSIKFSDLIRAFQTIFLTSANIEEAYSALFDGVARDGAEGFIEKIKLEAASDDNGSDDLLGEKTSRVVDDFVSRVVGEMREGRTNIVDMLGGEKVEELLNEYLEDTVTDGEKKKMTKTIDLIMQQIMEAVEQRQSQNDN